MIALLNVPAKNDISVPDAFESSERKFQETFNKIYDKIFAPIKDDKLFQGEDNEAVNLFKNLISLWEKSLREMISLNVYDSHLYAQNKCELECLTMIEQFEDWIEIYIKLIRFTADFMSSNSFQVLSKYVIFPQDFLSSLPDETLNGNELGLKATSVIFDHLLLVPIERISEYVNFLNKTMLDEEALSKNAKLQEVLTSWRFLQNYSSRELDIANSTKAFWDSAPRKLVEAHCIPSRRLILDCRSSPITLISGTISPRRLLTPYFILFNDVFIYYQYGTSVTFPLETVWVENVPNENENILENVFQLKMPEDNLTFLTDSPEGKNRWIIAFNCAIMSVLDKEKILYPDGSPRRRSLDQIHNNSCKNLASRRTPPISRRAKHLFKNNPNFNGAVYNGSWLMGKMQGKGELLWPNGKKFLGTFKDSQQNGEGEMLIKSDEGETTFTGTWLNGLMNGYGTVKYPSGDTFEGFFDSDCKSGFGILKRGKLYNTAASIYVGEWKKNKKHGYGVFDDKHLGEVYYGMWKEDLKHGNGAVVTIDGTYYEASFLNDQLNGPGLLMLTDGTRYEGELGPGGVLAGKGQLTLPNGDTLEGMFNGHPGDSLKFNGSFKKGSGNIEEPYLMHSIHLNIGSYSVIAKDKWTCVFQHMRDILKMDSNNGNGNSCAWDAIAASLNRKRKTEQSSDLFEYLQHIPKMAESQGKTLSAKDYLDIKRYISSASGCECHPIGNLMSTLVNVYRTSYVGTGFNLRLLPHAIQEIESFINRSYAIICFLFPDLPAKDDCPLIIPLGNENGDQEPVPEEEFIETEDGEPCLNVTPSSILHPILLLPLYSTIKQLYALKCEKEDNLYWDRFDTLDSLIIISK